MRLITDLYPSHVYPTVAAAEAVAAVLRDPEGDDLTYTVVADPTGTGKAIIEVRDAADGFFIAIF